MGGVDAKAVKLKGMSNRRQGQARITFAIAHPSRDLGTLSFMVIPEVVKHVCVSLSLSVLSIVIMCVHVFCVFIVIYFLIPCLIQSLAVRVSLRQELGTVRRAERSGTGAEDQALAQEEQEEQQEYESLQRALHAAMGDSPASVAKECGCKTCAHRSRSKSTRGEVEVMLVSQLCSDRYSMFCGLALCHSSRNRSKIAVLRCRFEGIHALLHALLVQPSLSGRQGMAIA